MKMPRTFLSVILLSLCCVSVHSGLVGDFFKKYLTTKGQQGRRSEPSKCSIDVQYDIPYEEPPVLLVESDSGQLELQEPQKRDKCGSFMSVGSKCENGSAVTFLACPGRRNSFSDGSATKQLRCNCRNNHSEGNVTSMNCKRKVSGTEVIRGGFCGPRKQGRIIKLGFEINGNFLELLEACQDPNSKATYYVQHELKGSHFPIDLSCKRRGSPRPSYQYFNKEVFSKSPDQYYSMKNQKQILKLVDPSVRINSSSHSYFSKGHLAPNGDFMLNSWRPVTFLWVNLQPQWMAINEGIWNGVEAKIRTYASRTGADLHVITGTEGVLKLPVNSPTAQPVYLGPDQTFPVPQMFWKIVRNSYTGDCIAFRVFNFPVTALLDTDCSTGCLDWGLRPKSGFHFECCSYSELDSRVSYLPKLDCSGTLQYATKT